MEKIIDLTKSIKEICSLYPEVTEIMRRLGFENITNPIILNTAGRTMTIPNGARMKKIEMSVIEEEFKRNGFILK